VKSYAKYTFVLPYSSGNKFVIHEHTGVEVHGFTPEMITPIWSNIKRRFETLPNIILLGTYPPLRLFYIPEIPDFTYGTFNDDAVLAKFERNQGGVSKIIIRFFEGMAKQAHQLHHQWISCQLELD